MPRSHPALFVALLALLIPPPAAAVAPEPPTDRALALLSVPYASFLTAKREDPAPPFDWSTDGCSHAPGSWARLFDGPCQQHDFGYRNLGRGLRLQRTEDTRLWVDRRLLTETRRVCAERRRGARRTLCDGRARAIYAAVRWFNAPWD